MPVKEEGFSFDGGRLYGGSVFIAGEANLKALKAVLLELYGPPTTVDSANRIWSWRWKKPKVIVQFYYEERSATATVSTIKE